MVTVAEATKQYLSLDEKLKDQRIAILNDMTELIRAGILSHPQVFHEARISNLSVDIPFTFNEDIKRFTVANVADVDITKQLTEMLSANYYIIKEVRFYASGTAAADASHSIKDTDTNTVFAQGYYNEGSFSILSGNRNGRINALLRSKPTVTLNSGTGAAAQTWYGSVRYYYK